MLQLFVMYVLGLMSARVKSIVFPALFAALLTFGAALIALDGAQAGVMAVVYLVLSLGWFGLLRKTNDTIFLWFLILVPGPIVMLYASAAVHVAVFGMPQMS